MTYRPVARVLTVVCAAGALAAATATTSTAASCKKLKESAGCKLPNGASYQFTRSSNDEFQVNVDRGKATLSLRSNCAHELGKRFKFKSVPKIGKSYKFSATDRVSTEIDGDRTVVTTFVIAFTVKFDSARKATTKGTASATSPGAPATDSYPAEKPYESKCDLKRSLKRVQF